MYENISNETAISTYKDLTNCIKNKIVSVEELMFGYNDHNAKYDKFTHHTMIHDIRLAIRLGWRILHKRLGYAENVNTTIGRLSHEYDTDISQ